jgi:glycine/sarcosine N-methyltransferase
LKQQSSKLISANNFYDEISDFYEQMIDLEKNLVLRKNSYKNIFTVKGKIADIGCGIGLDSVALALNGHSVTAFDISQKMIEQTKLNALKYNVNISSHVHSFQTIPEKFCGKFNYVVSVGNTIAHVNHRRLKEVINIMHRLLLPGGKIFLHILNYGLIKKQNKRINNISNREGKIIIRFYDFMKEDIDFNILSFPQNSPEEFKLVTTKHYQHTKNEIESSIRASGFTKIRFMKNFAGEKFNVRDSKDMFIEAVKL